MDPNSDSAHYVKHKKGPGELKIKQNCKYCGSNHPRGKCPAFSKTCPKCNKVGHFPQVCKSAPGKKPSETGEAQSKKPQKQKVHQVTDYNNDDSIYTVQATRDRVQYFTLLDVHAPSQDKTMLMRFQLDSGATCSTMRLGDYMKLAGAPPPSTTGHIKVYGG